MPVSEFVYPYSSQRSYSSSDFDAWFAGSSSQEMYYNSQIFINEIFVRYGYSFADAKKSPGQAIYAKYKDKDWYQRAIASSPSQSQDTLLFNGIMNSTEYDNIMKVNSWQEAHGCTTGY